MKNILYLLTSLPLLFSCQKKYNQTSYDKVEEQIRILPLTANEVVLDSIWQRRDSLTYLRLVNAKRMMIKNSKVIPNWTALYPKLENLVVDFRSPNKIELIPNSLGNSPGIKQISLKNNNIINIPDSFYNLKSLTYLNLDQNKVLRLSEKIKNFTNLQSLHLANNPLSEIPEGICKLESLKSLVLANTKISELPKCIGNLPNLNWINVSGTQLTEFPIEILDAPKLETIDAKGLKLNNYKEVESICEKKDINFYYED